MHRKTILAAAIALALDAQAQSISGSALPTDGRVIRGEASITQSGAAMRIDQSSARAAIDWQSFSIGGQASVTFQQPSASAIALNRVLGASGSEIFGKLSSNGQVFLTNPNGILFGRSAQVDVGGLLATTLSMSPDDFMAGRYALRGEGTAGAVVNEGSVRAPRGSVAFVAPTIVNDGLIEAQHGSVSLAAANAATIEYMADGLVRIRVDEGALRAEITNSGVLRADGGSVILTAKALDNLATAVVNNSGIIEARTVEHVNGVVRLSGGDVYVSGTIDVSAPDGVGGTAHVLGDRVALVDSARIDASGALGGGEVLIGGDLGGRNPEIQNARYTYVAPDALVRADAVGAGDGGRVIVWSDEVARVYGTLSVRGGPTSGDGGFVETSGKQYLEVQRAPDFSAPAGLAGTWLLDPQNINIESSGDLNITSLSPFQPVVGALSSILSTSTLGAALDQGGTVIVDTSVALGVGAGDININATINKSSASPATLELRAHNNINFNHNIASPGSPMNLVLNADQDANGTGVVNIGNVSLNIGGGTINAASEVVNVGNATINGVLNAGTLNFSSGTLRALGDVNVATAFNWSGGTIRNTGRLATNGATSVSGFVTLDGGTWNNAGTVTQDGASRVTLANAAAVNNQTGAQWNLSSSDSAPLAGTGTFNNAGTFTKSGTATQNLSITALNNSGQVYVTGGALLLNAASVNATDTGDIDVASGATLQFAGSRTLGVGSDVTGGGTVNFAAGNVTLNDGYSLAGTGITIVSGGTASFNTTATTLSFANLLTISAGTLTGSDGITTNGLNWTGGAIAGGSGVLTTNGTTTVSGLVTLDARTWDNAGTVDQRGTSRVTLANNAVVNNLSGAQWSLNSSDSVPLSGTGTFNNAGTFTKSGTTTTSLAISAFNNSGQVNVAGGTLVLNAASATDTGDIDVASGATLQLAGTRTLGAGTDVTGGGTVNFAAGTVTVNDSYSIADTGSTIITGGTASFNTTTSTLRFANLVSISAGTLTGSDGITTNGLNWTGGTIAGGPEVLTTNGTTTVGGFVTLDARTWNNAGTVNESGASRVTLANNAVVNNQSGSQWNLSSSDAVALNGTGTFNNAGTFTKSGTATTSLAITAFNNSGQVNVAGGTLVLNAASATDTGDIDVATGATLQFAASRTLGTGSDVTGGGTVNFTSGSVTLNGSYGIAGTGSTIISGGTASFNTTAATLTFGKPLAISAGVLTGSDGVTTNGLNWSGGSITGTGLLTTNGTTSVTGFVTLDGRTWNNAGTVNESGASRVTLANAAVVNNQSGAQWSLSSSDSVPLSGAGTFNNAGTFTKTGTATNNVAITAFNNSGQVNVAGGTLLLSAPGAADTGDINVAAGTTLQFAAPRTLGTGSDVTGGGTVNFAAGTVTLNGSYGIAGTGSTLISGGTASFNTTAATLSFANTLSISAGTLNGSDGITTNGFNWTGGTIAGGPGVLTTSGTTTLGGFVTLDARTWNNAGTVNEGGASRVTLFNAAVNNQSGAQWNLISSDSAPLSGTGTFNNAGTFTKSGTASQALSITAVSNSGQLSLSSGNLNIAAPTFSQTGLLEVASGATLLRSGGFTNAGTIKGAGTVDVGTGTLVNNGTVAPGGPSGDLTGTLAITGNYTQGTGAQLNVELQGGAAGDFDVLAVSGRATLNGTLNVSYLGGYSGAGSHPVVTYASRTGTFATINDANALNVHYITNSLVLGTLFNTWIGTGGGDWSTASNWSLGHVPTSTEDAQVPDLNGASVITLAAAQAPRSFTFFGDETFQINSGGALSFAVASSINNGTLWLNGGSVGLGADLSLANLTWTSGTIAGAKNLATSGTSSLTGFGNLDGATWNNAGTVTQSGASRLTFLNGAAVNNLAGAQWNLNSTDLRPLDGAGSFNNAGTVTKSGAGAQAIMLGAFNNTGLINVAGGTLDMAASSFLQAGTVDLAAGATFLRAGGFTNDGLLQGTGSFDVVDGTLMNAGLVSPAGTGAVGTLTVNGDFAQTASGSVLIELGGQDVLAVNGNAILDGALNVSHLAGFNARAAAVFNPITYASASGDFSTKNFPVGADYDALPTAMSYQLAFKGSGAQTSVTGTVGFEPATVATAGMTSSASAIGSEAGAGATSLVALSAQPSFVLPDVSHLLAAMNDLRKKKVQAVDDAVRILERDPGAADLPPCAAQVVGSCIAQRPTEFDSSESGEKVVPELAHIWGIERKIALVIGVAEYHDPIPRLDSPLKDVAEIGRLYRDQFGYEVRTLTNADKAAIVREINRLILETRPNDSVMVFYAGHGHVVEKTGRGYWIPGKANGEDPTQWISNSDIAKMLANIPARQVLLVSDSCYSGTLTREAKVEKSEVLSDPRAVLQRRSVTVLSSGGEEPVADAGKDGHSVFAWHLIRTLGRVAQWSNGVDIYERVAESVQLDFPQEPQYGAAIGSGHELGADYLFEVRRY